MQENKTGGGKGTDVDEKPTGSGSRSVDPWQTVRSSDRVASCLVRSRQGMGKLETDRPERREVALATRRQGRC